MDDGGNIIIDDCTVMDHLDVVASSFRADPVAAWLAESLRGGLLEDVFDMGPRVGISTRHERRTIASSFLTTGYTGSNKEEALRGELLDTAGRVGVVRVTSIDDDVALLQERLELFDERVDSGAGLDEENDLPWGLELLGELLDGVGALDIGTCNQ